MGATAPRLLSTLQGPLLARFDRLRYAPPCRQLGDSDNSEGAAAEPRPGFRHDYVTVKSKLRWWRAGRSDQLNRLRTSSMPCANKSSPTWPLAAVARIFSAAATAASAAAARTSASAW